MKTRSGQELTNSQQLSRKERVVRRQRNRHRMNAAEARKLAARDRLAEQIPLPSDSDDSIEENRQENQREQQNQRKMTEFLNKIEKLKLEGNLSENWRRFKRYFDIYMRAGEMNGKNDEIKINLFLNAVGEEAIEIFDTFELTEAQRQSYNDVIEAFESFCKPKKNTVYERFMFYQRKQKDGEPFDTFLMDIKRLAKTCEFAEKEREMLRDQIVMGIYDKKVQLKLLETSDLNYEKAVEKGRQGETTKEQIDTMNSRPAEINEIRNSSNTQNRNTTNHVGPSTSHTNNNKQRYTRNSNGARGKPHRRNDARQNQSSNDNKNEQQKCKYCNLCHKFGSKNCPAFGKKCNVCSKDNHFASVCRMKNVSTISVYDDSSYDFNDNEEFMIATLLRDSCRTDDAYSYPWLETITVNDSSVQSKIDTGAGVDIMPMSVLKKIAPHAKIERTSITLRAFAGEQIKPIGTCLLIVSFRKMDLLVKFAIVDFDCTPILGLKTCIRFKIVQPSRERVMRSSNGARTIAQ